MKRLHYGSGIEGWSNAPRVSVYGRASQYAYNNAGDTSGLPILTRDPAGQLVHIANQREAAPWLKARTMVDGAFGPMREMQNAPRFNGVAALWEEELRLIGGEHLTGQNMMVPSRDWGASVRLPTTYSSFAVAITNPAIQVGGTWLVPCHYSEGGQVVCGVLRSSDRGLPWTKVGPISLPGADLVEPAIIEHNGRVLMVMRREKQDGAFVAGPFYQTWLWPDGQQVAGQGPVAQYQGTTRVGGSPCCLGYTADGKIVQWFAEGKDWQGWMFIEDEEYSQWICAFTVQGDEPHVNDAQRYIAFQDGWLIAAEPDLLRPAQQCYVHTGACEAVQLTEGFWTHYGANLTASEAVLDVYITETAHSTPGINSRLLYGDVGWRVMDQGALAVRVAGNSWPTLRDLWRGIEKRLRLVLRPGREVEFWINDELNQTRPWTGLLASEITADVAPGAVWEISRQELWTP